MNTVIDFSQEDKYILSNHSSGNIIDERTISNIAKNEQRINKIFSRGFSISSSANYFPALPFEQTTNLHNTPVPMSGVEDYITENFEYISGRINIMTLDEYYDLCRLAEDIFKDGLPEDEIKI